MASATGTVITKKIFRFHKPYILGSDLANGTLAVFFFLANGSCAMKSCCHVIAIPQAGIAAPTLTVMQGFKAKKKIIRAIPSLILHTASILRILPFHAFTPQVGIEPGCEDWKLSAVTTTLRSLHQLIDKMSYLNQMYEKGNGSIRKKKKYRKWSLRIFYLKKRLKLPRSLGRL